MPPTTMPSIPQAAGAWQATPQLSYLEGGGYDGRTVRGGAPGAVVVGPDAGTEVPDCPPAGAGVLAPQGASLDGNCTKLHASFAVRGWRTPAEWREYWRAKRRRARAYQRAMSGLRLHHGHVIMLTLTQSAAATAKGLDIQASWRALVMRLRRRGLLGGYLRVREYTKKGVPHLHVLAVMRPMRHRLLSRWWNEIHLSPVVWLKRVWRRPGAAGYLARHLGKDPAARYSWSWDWVWRGFTADWRQLVRDAYAHGADIEVAVGMWEMLLDTRGARLYPYDTS